MAVIWACIGGALLAILVLIALQMRRTPTPGDDPGTRDGDAEAQTPGDGGLDPDDEKVAFADRRRYPTRKWDPMPGESPDTAQDDPDDVVDEDDRATADRPRHPANRWERD